MGENDIAQKHLEDFDDVFADIVNALVFGGEQVIKPDELSPMKTRGRYSRNGHLSEMERDVAKHWSNSGIKIACVGFENQLQPDDRMVLRVLGYDGIEYQSQCTKKGRKAPPYPVVTLVLYFGYERRWTAPTTLFESVDIPEAFKPLMTDFKLNVYSIAWLTDEQVAMFKSDFRFVADYFVQKRKSNGHYVPSTEQMEHVEAVCELLSVLDNDRRFVEVFDDDQGKDAKSMSEVVQKFVDQGIQEGIKEGIREGTEKGRILEKKHIAAKLLRRGNSLDDVADLSELSVDEVRIIAEEIGVVSDLV